MLTLHCVTMLSYTFDGTRIDTQKEKARGKKTSPTSITGSIYAVTTSMQTLKTRGHDESWTLRS